MKVTFAFIFAMLLLSGCSPTKVSTDIPNNPISNSQVFIFGDGLVSSPSKSGKAPYAFTCMLQYVDTGKSNSDFNSAVVTVNGVALTRVYNNNGVFQNAGDTRQFSQGDSLEFIIKHQKIGTIREILYVPASVIDVSVSPSPPLANLPNNSTVFKLSWNPVSASYYQVAAFGYNYWETILVSNSWLATAFDTATVVLQDSSGNACPYVSLQVQSFNGVPLQGFAPGSGFQVSGTYFRVYTNM